MGETHVLSREGYSAIVLWEGGGEGQRGRGGEGGGNVWQRPRIFSPSFPYIGDNIAGVRKVANQLLQRSERSRGRTEISADVKGDFRRRGTRISTTTTNQ